MHKVVLKNQILKANHGETLLAVLRRNDIEISALCGGAGKCGKCKVKITNNTFDKHPLITEAEHAEGICLACTVKIQCDLQVELLHDNKTVNPQTFQTEKIDGVFDCAIDIGTTGVSIEVYDSDKNLFQDFHFQNPQIAYGADVISRIKAWDDGFAKQLTELICEAIEIRLAKFNIQNCCISANTTMLHILADISPSGIGRAPYKAEFLAMKVTTLDKLGLAVSGNCVLLPSISAYVGADIVAGGIACDMESEENVLLLDLGTNGEMLLKTKNGYFACSTAAGPCFEGGNISCGTYFHKHAIVKVWSEHGEIKTSTAQPTGICGSGLIDAMRVLLDIGCVDAYGSLDENHNAYKAGKGARVAENIYLSDKDVRNIQLAKSAISTGIQMLIKSAGLTAADIKAVLVAGAFSNGINFESAGKIGLIPENLIKKCRAVGNGSLKGSKMCLFDSAKLALASKIAKNSTVIDLARDENFANLYAENLIFENYE